MTTPSRFFVTGTDTDAGKTVASALLVHALQADYWKPIQSGRIPHTDSEWIQRTLGCASSRIHPEGYLLELPASPHASAAAENTILHPENLVIPSTSRPLIIEGAGGLMVPLRTDYLFIDWLAKWKFPTILVVHTVLGCINHSLLSLEALRSREIPIAGIIFNDGGRPESESVILEYSGTQLLGKIPKLAQITPQTLQGVWEQHFDFPY